MGTPGAPSAQSAWLQEGAGEGDGAAVTPAPPVPDPGVQVTGCRAGRGWDRTPSGPPRFVAFPTVRLLTGLQTLVPRGLQVQRGDRAPEKAHVLSSEAETKGTGPWVRLQAFCPVTCCSRNAQAPPELSYMMDRQTEVKGRIPSQRRGLGSRRPRPLQPGPCLPSRSGPGGPAL